jgi:hypothetical protein
VGKPFSVRSDVDSGPGATRSERAKQIAAAGGVDAAFAEPGNRIVARSGGGMIKAEAIV